MVGYNYSQVEELGFIPRRWKVLWNKTLIFAGDRIPTPERKIDWLWLEIEQKLMEMVCQTFLGEELQKT